MRTFPSEFSAALKPAVWSRRSITLAIAQNPHSSRLRWFPHALPSDAATKLVQTLEKRVSPFLRPIKALVDEETITGMETNFAEALPKTLRNWSVSLNSPATPAYKVACDIGLVSLLKSESLREFASAVSGFQLSSRPGMQVIRYGSGDYVGPHNDHHPEDLHLRNGYVDLQITLSQPGVARQYLIYEKGGFFNQLCNVGIKSGVAVSMLPFWHQVTPLEVKPGQERDAHRWLLLASFEIVASPNR